MDTCEILDELGLSGAAYAAPVVGGGGTGFKADDLVTPASVLKIQVALAIETAITSGAIDGSEQRVMSPERRTPGPVGISLMRDEVSMSVRDLVVTMLTISDNVATDELITIAGLEQVNRLTRELGLVRTRITNTLRDMLEAMAAEVGFPSYAALVAHDPDIAGPPSVDEIRRRLTGTAALDPTRGTRTTAAETVKLLRAIWTNRAGAAPACQVVRQLMGQQLTRHRIASGFGPQIAVAAKSGGLLGIVRNEAGVVTFPDGAAYAVAVFTRNETGRAADPALIDAGIGRIAHALIDELRDSRP